MVKIPGDPVMFRKIGRKFRSPNSDPDPGVLEGDSTVIYQDMLLTGGDMSDAIIQV
jgi:hypothetical protein